jgi:hypothetical protein
VNTSHMEDDWIDGGQYSAQTVMDLRDCVRRFQLLAEGMAKAIEHERDAYPTTWKYSHVLQHALSAYRNEFQSDTNHHETTR